jgi:hypothetical protein
MSDSDTLTDAERAYLNSGEVTDQLLQENKDAPPADTPPDETSPEVVADGEVTEPVEDAGDEPGAPGQPPKRVGYRRYQEIEQRAITAEKRLQDQAVSSARVDERLKLLQEALQEPRQDEITEEEGMPNPQEDIFGAFNWAVRQINGLNTKVTTYEQQIATGQREMENEKRYFDDINHFAGREPNFVNAYNYLLQGRTLDLMSQRYAKPDGMSDEQFIAAVAKERVPNDIAEQIRNEERSLYREAFEKNQSPAEHIFRYALARGFRAQPPKQALSGQKAANVSRETKGEQRVNTPTVMQVIEGIKNGKTASQSLSNASGSAGGTQLTPQMLVDMSEEEFAQVYNAIVATGDKTKLRELFGS